MDSLSQIAEVVNRFIATTRYSVNFHPNPANLGYDLNFASLIQLADFGRRQHNAKLGGGESDHKQHHDVDAGLVLQAQTGVGDGGPGVDVKGEGPARRFQFGGGRLHESPFLIECNPPQRLTALVSMSNSGEMNGSSARH